MGDYPAMHALRRSFRRLPASPRCKLCYAPFHGVGGFVLRPWFGPWERNPQLCKNCFRLLAGAGHAAKAIAAGRELLAKTSAPDATATGPIPVGIGVHTGIAFVGTVGSSDEISDFTALGDAVNATARLASSAGAGELLVSVAAADQASFDSADGDRRTVDVRGREAGLEVYSIRADTARAA